MKYLIPLFSLCILFVSANHTVWAQEKSDSLWSEKTFSGLPFRSIGPALMSGRIADMAIHPDNQNTWYAAVGSGGVWKTQNAGITWVPIFDDQTSYSIGCITVDENNPNIIWVGTGENVGGRHVGYGDGIYRSNDGGTTWENRGLKNSEHISEIIVKPGDSKVLWVAVQGPLWSKGGERGLYKSIDGGKSWKRTLGDDEWTGVTDIAIDPRNPDRLYAVTWQRHRTTAAYMGGGPGTGLYRSADGGETWEKLTKGLPESNMGKIGLAISPQQPDVVYAAIELDNRTGGVYRSVDQGANWEKRSDTKSGGTGPHYYQELYASPHQFDRIYLADVRMQISEDGGKTFRRMKEKHKHSDNHALVFRDNDPNYLLVGTDGGLYESFDLGEHWRFMANLPVTQFYKLALDDSNPFYRVYGGTQDNSTQGGPVRTDKVQGIENGDWTVILNWDGHQPATEPGNPNIVYGQRQQGTLARVDMITGEVTDIQPQPDEGESYERFNWDAPILVSPHAPSRIFFASQRLWRSDDRGDNWQPISGDLTRNQNRFALPIMGRTQSWDNPWDVYAMSNYNTITSIAESSVQRDLIYVGTDDGLIQITENGGGTWRKIEASTLPGVPKLSYVNDIKTDLFDANTAYIALDNHKQGDFEPYILITRDKGKTWRSIRSNLPKRTLVWRIVQDHIKPELLFAATEFGIYFSVNRGMHWTKMKGGVPTIPFRDLAIQKRENDLVGASFGRGFYVLDDYSLLREVSDVQLEAEATLFPVRKAWRYIPRSRLSFTDQRGSQGSSYYTADNPPFGAIITYYLKEDLKTKKQLRAENEKKLTKEGRDIPFPGWANLESERTEPEPKIKLLIKDNEDRVVRWIEAPATQGFHRVAWDLRYPSPIVVPLKPKPVGEESNLLAGFMVAPGSFSVTMYKEVRGEMIALSTPQQFDVVPLKKGALTGSSHEKTAAFWRKYEKVVRSASAVDLSLRNSIAKVKAMQTAFTRSNAAPGELHNRLHALGDMLSALDVRLHGNKSRQLPGEKVDPTIKNRLFVVQRVLEYSTYGPTGTGSKVLDAAIKQLNAIRSDLSSSETALSALVKEMVRAGAPYIEGEALSEN